MASWSTISLRLPLGGCQSMRAALRRTAPMAVSAHRPAAASPQLYVVHRRVFSSETPASIAKAIPITGMQKGGEVAGGSLEADQGKEHSRENPRTFGEASVMEWPLVYFEMGKGRLSLLVTMTTTAGFVPRPILPARVLSTGLLPPRLAASILPALCTMCSPCKSCAVPAASGSDVRQGRQPAR